MVDVRLIAARLGTAPVTACRCEGHTCVLIDPDADGMTVGMACRQLPDEVRAAIHDIYSIRAGAEQLWHTKAHPNGQVGLPLEVLKVPVDCPLSSIDEQYEAIKHRGFTMHGGTVPAAG